MTIVIESTSSNAGLIDPYGGLHHRTTTTTTRAANSPEHENNCSPGGGENGVKLVLPKSNVSSSERCHLVAFQRKDNSSSNNNNIDNDDDERKGHPAVSTAPVGGARRRIGNYFAILLSSLVSIIPFFPRSLWNQLYSYPNNFNDGKSKINQLHQQQQQFSHLKRCRLLFIMVAVIIATITLLPQWRLLVGEEDRRSHSIIQSSLLSSALQQCSSSSSIQQQQKQQRATNNINNNNNKSSLPSNKYILVASHLRAGSDGQLRLRIIEHNLRMLSYSSSSSSSSIRPQQQHYPPSVLDEDDHALEKTVLAKRNNEEEDVPPSTKKMECILIFSIDETYNTTIHAMVQTWQNSISSSLSNNIISQNMNITILYVPNDNVMVDASKWMMALYSLLPTLLLQLQLQQQQQDYYSSTSTRIMLINDSFLLTRPIPELWNNNICGSVCGLVWTGPNNGSDHTRHIQSYIRTLDICAIIKYMNFYERNKLLVHNVNELIVLFEINLDWAHDEQQQQQQQGVDGGSNSWWSSNSLLRGSSSSSSSSSSSNRIGDDRKEDNNRDVTALSEYAGGHPDDEHVQHVLLTKNYPAIKLKKFFITNDPWLFAVLDKKKKADHNNNGTTTTSFEKEMDEEDLPPSFSTTIYRRTNHDLNHLSDNDLRTHFRTSGKYENRIYSNTLPLVMKGWLRTELERMEKEYNNNYSIGDDVRVRQADTTIAILDDYLAALNRDILGK